MTFAQIRSLVRNLVFERTGEIGLVTDPELGEIINSAARTIYLDIARFFPEAFAERSSPQTVTPPATSISFATLTPTGQPVHKILGVEVAVGAGTSRKPILPLNRPIEKLLYEPAPVPPVTPYRWYIEGPNLYFTPTASAAFNAMVTFLRTPGPDLAADADTPWGNMLQEHHDKIAILASKLVYAKDEKNQSPYDTFLQYVMGQLSNQYRQSPRDYGKKTREPKTSDEE